MERSAVQHRVAVLHSLLHRAVLHSPPKMTRQCFCFPFVERNGCRSQCCTTWRVAKSSLHKLLRHIPHNEPSTPEWRGRIELYVRRDIVAQTSPREHLNKIGCAGLCFESMARHVVLRRNARSRASRELHFLNYMRKVC